MRTQAPTKPAPASGRRLIPLEVLEQTAPMLRIVAHPLRLRILDYLVLEGEPRTVSQIMAACGSAQAIASQQLRLLKDQRVLACRREGSYVYYSIADPSVRALLACIRQRSCLDQERI